MNYRNLGNSGLKVSELGLGTNSFGKRADRETSIRILHTAIDRGINFIDTANIYAGTASERIIGEGLQGGKRQQVVLTTKAGLPMGEGPNDRGGSRYHLERELDQSLKRLQTDYVDLYQIHTFDPYTPLEETLRTLDDMVRSGKVRYIGASNYAAWELMKALGISNQLNLNRYVSIQTSYSLADRTPEKELVPLCLDQGLGIIPYFPLAGGILTGKYSDEQPSPSGSRADTDPSFQRFFNTQRINLGKVLSLYAENRSTQPATLALAWLLKRPAVATVIVGATHADQLESNLNSLEYEITDEVNARLDEMSRSNHDGEPFASYRI